jgi:hypothetical protein
MKDTRDIIENVLRAHAIDYDLADSSTVKASSKSKELVEMDNGSNVLVSEKERENGNLEDMENYQPCRELCVDANEVKETFEKKKKKRNYIESKADYMKVR